MASVLGVRYGVGSTETYNATRLKVDGSHVEIYVVQMDSVAQREDDVASVVGVPAIGAASSILTGAYCVSRNITEIAPLVWEVECEFSDSIDGEAPNGDPPWNRTQKESWSFETIEEPLLVDAQDNSEPIANSAGEALPPVGVPVAIPVLTIRRTQQTFNPQTILDFVNHVNDATFRGAAAGQALMAGIQADPAEIQGTSVWEVVYSIKFKMDQYGWKLRLLDQGTYYWSGAVGTSQRLPFGDDAFQQIIGNLDGSGGKNTTATPEFVEYNRYDEADFSTLSL